MNGANDIGVSVVNRLPVELFLVKLEDRSDVVEGFVDGLILDGLLAFGADQLARQLALVGCILSVVHGTIDRVLGRILVALSGKTLCFLGVACFSC